jgi:hypothetical protein
MGDHAGSLTVGKLIAFQLQWGLMNSAYSALISVLNSFTRASGAAQRVLTLMDNLPDIDPNSGIKPDAIHGDIKINDLYFHYQMRPDQKVLNGVNLHIKPNTVTALVGKSGGRLKKKIGRASEKRATRVPAENFPFGLASSASALVRWQVYFGPLTDAFLRSFFWLDSS